MLPSWIITVLHRPREIVAVDPPLGDDAVAVMAAEVDADFGTADPAAHEDVFRRRRRRNGEAAGDQQ